MAQATAASSRMRGIPLERLRPLLPALAVASMLLALWMAWGAWRQWRQDAALSALETARDQALQGASRALKGARDKLAAQVATPGVRFALRSGDLGAVADAIGNGWAQLEQVQVMPASLDQAYAEVGTSGMVGFGPLAVAEASLSSGAPVARLGKQRGDVRLFVAMPLATGAGEPAVVIVRLPTGALTAALDAADVETGYLALRQGSFSLRERGDAALAGSAEALAAPVPDSDLRISAGLPRYGQAPFGLGSMPALVAALLLLALSGLCVAALRRRPAADAATDEPTLAQALQAPPPPVRETDAPAPDDSPSQQKEPAMPSAPPQHTEAVAIDKGIFRAYDIRGVVGDTLDAGVAEHIGQAIGTLMHDKDLPDIVVGRDGRLSGPDMVAGLVAGLRKAGRNVIDIGQAPTPLVYFGSYFLRTGCCVAVTGSHNPPDYNGFKIVVGGETLSGDTITDLYERIAGGRLHTAAQPGELSQRTIDDDYVQRIAEDVVLQRPLKVVVDAGNGVAGGLGPRVLEAIGAVVVPLYCEIDGTFPNHHPDPSEPHNLEDLIERVRAEGADLGVAFDGDGDRLGVVTPQGDNIFPDRLLMLFAADVLERNPGAVILYDVKCTGHLSSHVLRHGGSPLMWKTGHSLIKAKMRETEAALAGEMSGHFFFAERWFGFDDGIYAAARLLEILSARDEAPGDVLRALPGGVSTPEIKIQAPGGDPHAFVEGFRARARFEDARISTIDGLRVDWPDGWGLIRASNTTPVLVLRFDADSQEALDRIKDAFREQLGDYDPGLPVLF